MTAWRESAKVIPSPAKGDRVKNHKPQNINMITQQNTTVVPSQSLTKAGKLVARKSAPATTVWEALEWLHLDAYEAQKKSRSAWDKGIAAYIEELLFKLAERLRRCHPTNPSTVDIKELLLYGADNWTKYSFGGNSLVCNTDIAERLAPPSRRKRLENNGNLAMTCQEQAASRIIRLWSKYTHA